MITSISSWGNRPGPSNDKSPVDNDPAPGSERNCLDNAARKAKDFVQTAKSEVSSVVNEDPSFAFRQAANIMKGAVLEGVPETVLPPVEKGFYPMVRGASLVLDACKAKDTLADPQATTADKAIDCGHVATDMAGVAGAFILATSGATIGASLAAVGVLGDVTATGYHAMRYLEKMGQVSYDPDPHAGTPSPVSSNPSPPINPS